MLDQGGFFSPSNCFEGADVWVPPSTPPPPLAWKWCVCEPMRTSVCRYVATGAYWKQLRVERRNTRCELLQPLPRPPDSGLGRAKAGRVTNHVNGTAEPSLFHLPQPCMCSSCDWACQAVMSSVLRALFDVRCATCVLRAVRRALCATCTLCDVCAARCATCVLRAVRCTCCVQWFSDVDLYIEVSAGSSYAKSSTKNTRSIPCGTRRSCCGQRRLERTWRPPR